MTDYDVVLFDNDGVLVEPPARETQLRSLRDAFRELGVEAVDREHLLGLASGVTVEQLHAIAGAYDLEPAALWNARERHDERGQIAAFEAGDRDRYDDVAAVAELPVDCGIVSNNHHTTVEFVLEHFEMASLFDTYYGREMTVESLGLKKPEPHYLERALADLDAETGLYVGDSESDVVAARRAGLDAAFLRRAHCRDVALEAAPDFELEDLNEVAAMVDDE